MTKTTSRLFGILSVLAVIGTVLMSGASVLANNVGGNDTAAAFAYANGGTPTGDSSISGFGYAEGTVDANGNPLLDTTGTEATALAKAYADATSMDDSSSGWVWVDARMMESADGSVTATGIATGQDGGDAEVLIGRVYIGWFGGDTSSGDLNVTATAKSTGVDALAKINTGYAGIENAEGTIDVSSIATSQGLGADAEIGFVYFYIDTDAYGDIDVSTNAAATGEDAYSEIGIYEIYVSGHSIGSIGVSANTVATGEDADATIWMDYVSVQGSSMGTVDITANASAAAWADASFDISRWVGLGNSSIGTVNIVGNSSAAGDKADAAIDIFEAYLYESSSGGINIAANATANGDNANAEIDLRSIGIWNTSHGTVNVAATATATGDDSYAEVGNPGPGYWGDISLNDGSTGEIKAVLAATAENGGEASVNYGIGIKDESFGVITVYCVAEAFGSGSEADSRVYLDEVPDSGFYFDIDANGNALAFAVMLSDGTNAFAIIYAQANGGENAIAWMDEDGAFAAVGLTK